MMKVHILQHVPFEGLGSIREWLRDHEAEVSSTRFFLDEIPLDPSGLDLVIAMGGPMSSNEEATHPWLKVEKRFIREAGSLGIAMLGVCLGAQLIADAYGARIRPNKVREIGWFPVWSVPVPAGMVRLPVRFMAFHWHGETFDLPKEAILLARSEGCENQAFQIGERIIGLQFHLECTPESVALLIKNCRSDLSSAGSVQSEEEILSAPAELYKNASPIMSDILSYLVRPVT
jgi:GMP synthase-like glutamine amidotransferase